MRTATWVAPPALAIAFAPAALSGAEVEHAFATHDGVKIHYVTAGSEGPLVVMVHGFPDFWYTWKRQLELLRDGFRVAAIDLRGYNKSDKPEGVDAYAMDLLVGDVAAVVEAMGEERAIICGHDWGGAIAWAFAMQRPEMTEGLIVLNLPHPRGLMRELATNPKQRENSSYARAFQREGAHEALTARGLTWWVKDKADKPKYIAAMERSDFQAMLNIYKKNYPRPPYTEPAGEVVKVKCPVLMIHGLDDPALLPGALAGTWDWVERDLTLVTVPGAGHWVHHDAPELVNRAILSWLKR